jgi:hypothetical protein
MDDRELRLDGNAAAGLFQDLFTDDVTIARGACASCGAVAEMGAQHVYMYHQAPGAVVRCRGCDAVLMVLVHGGGRLRLGLRGLAWLEVREPRAPAAQATGVGR